MKQHWFTIQVLVFFLLQVSCMTRAPNASPIVAPRNETNLAPEGTATQPVDIPRVTKIHEWSLPAQNVKDIKWSPTGNYFIILTEEHATLYDARTLEELWRINPIAPAYYASAAAFSSDEKTLILFIRLTGLQKRDNVSGLLLAETPEDNNPANCFPSEAVNAVLSSNGKSLFVSTSREDPQQQSYIFSEIHKWDIPTLKCVNVLEKIEGDARSLDLSSNGKFLALGVGLNTTISGNDMQEEGQISVRNVENGQQACLIEDQGSLARFKPETSILLVTDPDNDRFVYWDVETCHIIGELKGISSRYNFSFSPDGQLLAIWNNGISLIDSGSGNVLRKIDDPIPDNVFPINRLSSSLSFSPNGHHLIYSVRRDPIETMIFLWAVER